MSPNQYGHHLAKEIAPIPTLATLKVLSRSKNAALGMHILLFVGTDKYI